MDDPRPLGGYALLSAVYTSLTGAFAVWFARSGRSLPDRVEPYDLALVTAATHKTARLVAKDKITGTIRKPFTEHEGDSDVPGEVSDVATGGTLRRAVGELVTCPYCLGVWVATAYGAGLLVAPRLTRQVASMFTAVFGADVLQALYRKLSA